MYNQAYFQKHTAHFGKLDLNQIPSFAWIKNELEIKRGEKVLDAGCGTGYLLDFVCGQGKGTGVDLSAAALKIARQQFPSHRFLKADLAKLPFKRGEFDKVFCFNVIEHLGEQEKALKELKRVLKKSGVIVAGTNIMDSFSWQLFKFFLGGDESHLREFGFKEFVDFISQEFEIKKAVRSSCIGRFPELVNKVFHQLLKGDVLVKGVKE